MRHITLSCPDCKTPERVVGDVTYGRYHCFGCGRNGTLSVGMTADLPATADQPGQHTQP